MVFNLVLLLGQLGLQSFLLNHLGEILAFVIVFGEVQVVLKFILAQPSFVLTYLTNFFKCLLKVKSFTLLPESLIVQPVEILHVAQLEHGELTLQLHRLDVLH